jgi:hypothetical protein
MTMLLPHGSCLVAARTDLFFSTKRCLRHDQSTCFPAGHQYYDITHSGLGAMVSHAAFKYMRCSKWHATMLEEAGPSWQCVFHIPRVFDCLCM